MPQRHLNSLFKPASLTVIGATDRHNAAGAVVMDNLLAGGFGGPIMPVHPSRRAVKGILAYPDVASLPRVPDLALICTRAETIPGLVRALGEKGTRAAVVMAAGLAHRDDGTGRSLLAAALAEARGFGMRLLGPNSVGLSVPAIGLNAGFADRAAAPGKIAFISQSGALSTAVIDWANAHGIGFSHFISLGDSADVDCADALDYLASDPGTAAILLYVEAIGDARKFMSAARAAARNKPVLAIKAGRSLKGARAAATHSGALAGADAVVEAALRRAGILRVNSFAEIFEAVETLGHITPSQARAQRGDRLAVLTNGGGVGVLAVDALDGLGGHLAELSPETTAKLDAVLPVLWSRDNPIDLLNDAGAERYLAALNVLLDAAEVDAVLVMHCPIALTSASEIAGALIQRVKAGTRNKPVSACWLGEGAVAQARRLFDHAHLPDYDTPEQAVRAYMHLVTYRRNQEILLETPASMPKAFRPDSEAARAIIGAALARGASMLDEHDSKRLLAAYGIPVAETRVAASPSEAGAAAERLGYPVALKILSETLTHKSDVGGVVLDLADRGAVEAAAARMLTAVPAAHPDGGVRGLTVQPMVRRPGARELILGVGDDPVFGPVMLFGHGGTAAELLNDRAVALPPLNLALAKDLMGQTRVVHMLEPHRGQPGANTEAVAVALCRLSQMVCDLPELREVDINPLLADGEGVVALDARVRIGPAPARGRSRLAIRPYPRELEENFTLRDGRVALLRPIRPEDEPAHHRFHARLTPEDIRLRHFALVKEIVHSQMARMTQIDYDREMAFVASHEGETLGVVRVVLDPDKEAAEFSIIIRSDLKGTGLGRALFEKVIRYCKGRGVRLLRGETMRENRRMQELAQQFGFSLHAGEDGLIEMTKTLEPGPGIAAE